MSVEVGGSVIETTTEHPFWIIDRGWVEAHGIVPGDVVRLLDGTTQPVTRISIDPTATPTIYNFEVSGVHTYYVGNDGVLVHNESCGGSGGSGASKGALKRPTLRKGLRDAVEATGRTPDGKWIDANTGEVFEGAKQFGHKYGYEHRRLVKEAEAKGMNQEQFNDWINAHPDWFQIEKPRNNLSHKFEMPGD